MAHNVYIPKSDSIRFKVLELARENKDSLTMEQAFAGLPMEARDVVRAAMNANSEKGLMNRVGNAYLLAGYVIDHFKKVAAPAQEIYVGEPAASRYSKPFTEMKVTPWDQHLDRLRDISFKTASGTFQPLGYRL